MIEIQVESIARDQMVEITSSIAKAVRDSQLAEGLCSVYTAHTTCGITINENADPDVQHDILLFLRNLVPQDYPGFRHFEHNSDSHIKASLMGSSVVIPFQQNRLGLGRWQGIYLCEFDGPRTRTVKISIVESHS